LNLNFKIVWRIKGGPVRRVGNRDLNLVFLRQISLLSAGTGGAAALAFLFIPLITRLYGPEVYGLLGSYMALTLLLLPLASLTFPVAVVLAESARDALGLTRLSLW